MVMGLPNWVQSSARVLSWAAWQLFVLAFAFVVYVSVFGEYGRYPQPVVDVVAGFIFLAFAIIVGTVIPLRRWRAEHHTGIAKHDVDSGPGGI
jgi:hypothetical protein